MVKIYLLMYISQATVLGFMILVILKVFVTVF